MKSKSLNIAYVGEFSFPKGSAASIRVNSLGKLLRSLGHNVFFVGKFFHDKDQSNKIKGEYNDFEFFNIGEPDTYILKRIVYFIFGAFFIKNILRVRKVDVIILYGGYSRYLIPLRSFARKNQIKLVFDAVEWFDYSHLPLGRWGPFSWDVNYALTKLIPKCNGIIAISSFLENYYMTKGCNVVRIPVLVDTDEIKWITGEPRPNNSGYLNIAYAGFPGKKDLIGNLIVCLKSLNKEGHKVKLHLIGPLQSDLNRLMVNYKEIEKNYPYIEFYGEIDQELIPSLIAKCDFSILIRPNARYANAGFPTKLVESLASGVPVITNLTSDIGLYIIDGEQGLIMEDWTKISVFKTLKRASALKHKTLIAMKISARKTAKDKFHYSNYKSEISSFLQKL